MKPLIRRISLAIGLVALGATAVIACQAGAARMLAGRPSVVVTVNLSEVLDKLDQRAQAEVSLKAMRDAFLADNDKRQDQLKDMQTRLEAMKDQPDNAEKRSLQDQAGSALVDYQAWYRFASAKADLEDSLVMRDLYRAIKAAVKTMAEAEGYDIVLVDDSQGELMTTDDSRMPKAVQVKQQIIARRMLYSAPAVNITDHLITRMNNAFKAGPAPPLAAPQ
jgi:Skp family chaperone for outer membrane proteins